MSANARLVIGIDVGGTKALAGLIDEGLTVITTTKRPTSGVNADQLLDLLVEEIEELRAKADGEVVGVGLGIPALLDYEGRAWQAPNLPLVEDASIGAALAKRINLPVVSDNDANLAAIAEHRAGAGEGHEDVVLLTVGTGVGGGLIVRGKPLRGAHGMGAELGHIVVETTNGRPCIGDCPNRGCLESVGSGTALEREAAEIATEQADTPLGRAHAAGELDGPAITKLAQDGDELAIEALRRVGTWLGVGMSSLANIFDPSVILVGGGVSSAGELLVGPAREEFIGRAMPPIVDRCEVKLAQFGSEAGLLGAAIIAFDAAGGAPEGSAAALTQR